MAHYEDLVTPAGILGFANLVRENDKFGGFSMQLFLDPKEKEVKSFLETLKTVQATSIAKEKKENPQAKVRDINISEVCDRDPDMVQDKGLIRITLKSKFPPEIKDAEGTVLDRDREVTIGSKVKALILTRSYTFAGTAGMSLYAKEVTILEEAEPRVREAPAACSLDLEDDTGL